MNPLVVPTYTSSSDMNSVMTAPADGSQAVRTDLNTMQIYNAGSGWTSLINQPTFNSAISSLQSAINNLQNEVNGLQSQINGLNGAVNNAQNTANNAQGTANNAQGTANNALSQANSALSILSGMTKP